jgi:hypothetical protein
VGGTHAVPISRENEKGRRRGGSTAASVKTERQEGKGGGGRLGQRVEEGKGGLVQRLLSQGGCPAAPARARRARAALFSTIQGKRGPLTRGPRPQCRCV